MTASILPLFRQQVSDEGKKNAKIIVIGESPWIQEIAIGKPFVGQSGKLQDRWWFEVGLKREEMYIMNLYPFKPPSREIDSIPIGELVEWMQRLHQQIAELEDPKVIVALGNYVTFALTGKGKVKAAVRDAFSLTVTKATEAERKAGITKLRGSIYPYRDLKGRMIKVIPIIHPSAVLQTLKWEKRTVRDWERVREESNLPYQPAQRRHIIRPGEGEVADFVRQVEYWSKDIAMAVDIETWGKTLSCVGFALSAGESITIPTTGRDKEVFLPYIKRLCESGAAKVLCNGQYDWYWLAWEGIWLNNFLWDVQLMHHVIDPVENHSLDFLASIYAPFYQYWKDEAKDAEEIVKYSSDLESLWVYNGLDCCYTRELLDIILADLGRNNLVDFYFQHYQQMLEPLVRTMLHGIRVDKKAQKEWAGVLKGEMVELHQQLNEAAGEELFAEEERSELREPTREEWEELLQQKSLPGVELDLPPKAKFIDKEARARLGYIMSGSNAGKIRYRVKSAKKDFSNNKLMKFFYEKLGLPRQYKLVKGVKGKSKSVSLDEGSIRKMTAKWPDKIGNWGNLLLAYREKKKELDYLKGAWDGDGRIRCGYKMLTEAGRLSSNTNPRRTGFNLQNVKR